MSTLVMLHQGSADWHAHRRRFRNASETPAVLGCSPFVTPYQLWTYKTLRAEPACNHAMQYGSQMEAKARLAYEALTGLIMEPQVLIDGPYSASLDGIALDGECVLEIKCPLKGRQSETWQSVASGRVPEHYHWQVQHQLMVSGAQLAHLFVFDGESGIVQEIRPVPTQWQQLRQAWEAFQTYLDSDSPPPLTESDVVLRLDADWQAAAEQYQLAKQQQEQALEELAHAKQRLIGLCQHPCQKGFGVRVAKSGESVSGARITLYQETKPC